MFAQDEILRLLLTVVVIAVVCCFGSKTVSADDEIEFLNGSKITGMITEIRKDDKEFDVEISVAGRNLSRTYPFSKVHAVTFRGKRHELTPKPIDSADPDAKRSRQDIEKIIDTVGASQPDWIDDVKLNYPQTLDLSWPLKPPQKGWNNKQNVGQYMWDIVNPNPSRWQSGVKLVYQIMESHQRDRDLLQRDMKTLGRMYFNLFQDYPRAAYWLKQGGVDPGTGPSVMLAECYWRLGNEQMATSLLKSRTQHMTAIKLLGDMKETDKAVELARMYLKSPSINGQARGQVCLLAGDACRQAGEYDDAIKFYEGALNEKDYRNKEYGQRYTARAQDSIDAIRLFEKADISKVANGTYTDQAVGYNGPVVVEVVVADKAIESVKVTRHVEKQFYAAINDTTGQIKSKQRVTDIDATSGATITSQAIVNAAARALAKGSN